MCRGDRCSHRLRQVSSAQTSSGAAETPGSSDHGLGTGSVRGSCAVHWLAGCVCAPGCVGNVCARARVCRLAHVGENKGKREKERESIQRVKQLQADMVKYEICFCFSSCFHLHHHRHKQANAGVAPPLPPLPCFASVSPLCRCCGGYAEGYMWSSL